MYEGFLPTTKKEMVELGIEQFDFIYITGDAYVDHPSFGAAIVTRLIESMGFTVGIISQPDWHSDRDFRPELPEIPGVTFQRDRSSAMRQSIRSTCSAASSFTSSI